MNDGEGALRMRHVNSSFHRTCQANETTDTKENRVGTVDSTSRPIIRWHITFVSCLAVSVCNTFRVHCLS